MESYQKRGVGKTGRKHFLAAFFFLNLCELGVLAFHPRIFGCGGPDGEGDCGDGGMGSFKFACRVRGGLGLTHDRAARDDRLLPCVWCGDGRHGGGTIQQRGMPEVRETHAGEAGIRALHADAAACGGGDEHGFRCS